MSERFKCPRNIESGNCSGCSEVAKLAIISTAKALEFEKPNLLSELKLRDVEVQLTPVKFVGDLITCKDRRQEAEQIATEVATAFITE